MSNVISVDFVNKALTDNSDYSDAADNNPWDAYLESSATELSPTEFVELVFAIASPKHYENVKKKIQHLADGYFDIVYSTES